MVLCRWGFNVDYIQFIMFSDLRAILANLFLRLLPCACADTYANLTPLLLMNLSTKTIHRKSNMIELLSTRTPMQYFYNHEMKKYHYRFLEFTFLPAPTLILPPCFKRSPVTIPGR